MALARVGTQEDRTELRVGLQRCERPQGQDQVGRALRNVAQAMAAGEAGLFADAPFGRLAVGIGGAGAIVGGKVAVEGDETDVGH